MYTEWDCETLNDSSRLELLLHGGDLLVSADNPVRDGGYFITDRVTFWRRNVIWPDTFCSTGHNIWGGGGIIGHDTGVRPASCSRCRPSGRATKGRAALQAGHAWVIGTTSVSLSEYRGKKIKRPVAENFWKLILIFQSIYQPHRALQIRKNGILKLHTSLEICASNPILKTHFFELGENVVCKKSYVL